MMDRRRFLSTLLAAAGAAAGLAVGAGAALAAPVLPARSERRPGEAGGPNAASSTAPHADPNSPRSAASQPVRPHLRQVDLARGLPRGTKLAGSVVESVGETRCGTVPVVLRDPTGNRFQVDVARRDWLGPKGIGNTRQLSLYLSNEGGGATPTPEAHGLAVLALSHRLKAFERRGARWPELLTLQERLERHPGGAYQIC